VVYSLILYVM